MMNLFRAADRNCRQYGDPKIPSYLTDEFEDPDDELRLIYYAAPVAAIRDRLELEGYTIENCRRLFEEWRTLEIRRMEAWIDDDDDDDASPPSPDRQKVMEQIRQGRKADLRQLRELTVDSWTGYVRLIVEKNLTSKDAEAYRDSYVGQMLKSSDGLYGYEGPDRLVAIRLAMDALPNAGEAVYDLTDLAQSGYIDEDEDPIERLIEATAGDFHALGRVIILTEGRSDVALLKPSLDLLFPHLAGYFSFMDFAEYGGGAGPLVNLIRGFAGAGVVNRVIALFDNDAAALAAMRSLRKTALPKHVKAMRLPDLPALESYPTLGPTGLSPMNINGMAASLELYLGMDVLRNEAGELPPVQWTGYERSVGMYQGELLVGKQEVQARFLQKLARAREDRQFCESADWSGLRAIFSQVLTAFHSLDGEMLSAQLKYFYRES
jgi:hypothetical protein